MELKTTKVIFQLSDGTSMEVHMEDHSVEFFYEDRTEITDFNQDYTPNTNDQRFVAAHNAVNVLYKFQQLSGDN